MSRAVETLGRTVYVVPFLRHYVVSAPLAALTVGALFAVGACAAPSKVSTPAPASGSPSPPSSPSSPIASALSWKGFSGLGNYQVDSQTLLPLDRYGETPGESVLAQFVQASTTSRPLESLPVEVRSFPGLDPAVVRAAQLGVQSVSGLVQYWPPGVPVTFLVTEDSLDGEAWLRTEASTLGCHVGERWYPFDKEELPGSFSLGTCAGPGSTLVLNVSQFARPWADADLSRVIVTVGDDLFGLWQEYYNSGVLASEPRWLTQGSQQLPFLVYLARYAPGQVFRPSLSPGCLPDLTLYDFEDVAFNTEVSCPHEVGRAAMLLLVSRVGLDPVVKYFTQPASSLPENFEERFNDLAGESYRKFNARLLSWLTASN